MERLLYEGKIPFYSAKEVVFSRLGIGFEKLDRDVFDPNKAYDKVSAIGVKKIRLQSGWMRTEKQKGVYDFAWLDEIVDRLLSLGMEPWLCLCYGNPLYTDFAEQVFGAVGCPPIGSEEETEGWLRYVKATVAHFHGRISLYEIWNEPDCGYSWKHYFGQKTDDMDFAQNAREYGEFATKTAIAIKRADPSAKIAALAYAHIKHLEFANTALSTGLYRYIDYVTFHSYAVQIERRSEWIEAFRALVHSYNPAIKLIQGESGAQSRSDGHGALRGMSWNDTKQVKALLRILLYDLYAGVEFTSYFSTMDMIEALHGTRGDVATYLDYGYFGVLGAQFDEEGRAVGECRPKPSYYALSALCSLLRGDCAPVSIPYTRDILPSRRLGGTDCADNTVKTLFFRLADGGNAMIYWNEADLFTATYEGTVSYTVFGQKNDSIRLLDLRDGSLYRLPAEMVELLENGAVRLKNLPLTDCPLAIVFA